MALYKRGNLWWTRFTAPNGERVSRSTGTEEKKRAQEYEDHLKSEAWRVYKLGEKPRRTWKEAVVRWLQERASKADAKKDLGKLRWLDNYLGTLYLDEVNRDVVDAIKHKRLEIASTSTANRYLALIRAILRAARDEWEWIDHIPAIKLYKEPRKRVRWLRPDEAQRLLSELPRHLQLMAIFSLATGLRQSNVSYLRWDQVDLERGYAWIHPDESKSGRAINVPLNNDALAVLHEVQGEDRDYCFVYQGKPVERTSTKAWHAALKRAGIENFRWHDLRHTWASWHVQNGTSLQELQELGGWASFEMVLRYAHLAKGQLKRVANNVGGTIGTNLVQSQKVKSPAVSSEAFRIMVPRGGIEPPTRGFSILCSTD